MGEYQKAIDDGQRAVENDPKNIKAHLLLGQCICMLYKEKKELKKIESGITRMKKALSLCSSQQKRKFEDQIRKGIFRAKKLIFLIKKEVEDKEKQIVFKKVKEKIKMDTSKTPEEKQEILNSFEDLVIKNGNFTKEDIPQYFVCHLCQVKKN